MNQSNNNIQLNNIIPSSDMTRSHHETSFQEDGENTTSRLQSNEEGSFLASKSSASIKSIKSPVLSNSKLFETSTYDSIEDPAIRESLRQVDIAYQNMINLTKLDF